MSDILRPDHNDLQQFFADAVGEVIAQHVASHGMDDVTAYLGGLLAAFAQTDRMFGLHDAEGKPLRSVIEMIAAGDVRLNAQSFEQERTVHKHLADYILFWSGVYPPHLERLQVEDVAFRLSYQSQGAASYALVGSFDYPPHDAEAPTFLKLSEGFPEFVWALQVVARQIPLYAA